MHGEKLQHCDQQWVRRLSRGTLLVLIGVATVIPTFLLIRLIGRLFFDVMTPLLIVGGSIPWLLVITGLWMVTTPDPCLVHAESPLSARRLARLCPFALILNTAFRWLVYVWYSPQTPLPGTTGDHALEYMGMAMTVISIVGYLAMLRYFRTLAARLSEKSLSAHFNVAFWGMAISFVLFILALLVYQIVSIAPDGRFMPYTAASQVISLTAMFALVAFIVFGVWGLIDVIRLHVALRRRVVVRNQDVDYCPECGHTVPPHSRHATPPTTRTPPNPSQ